MEKSRGSRRAPRLFSRKYNEFDYAPPHCVLKPCPRTLAMNEPTPSPYQPGSFEHAVITGIAQLQTKMEGVITEYYREDQ
jgi:hypothetical protein